MFVCVGLNVGLLILNRAAGSPFFLDTIFTGVAAALLGPFAGAATGLLTNLTGSLVVGSQNHYWAFGVVNMASGIIIGVAGKRDALEPALPAVAVWALVTATNAILGALVAFVVFGGGSSGSTDRLAILLVAQGLPLGPAAMIAGIPINMIDKGLVIIASVVSARYIKPRVVSRLAG